MSKELIKDKIVLNQNIGKESTQILLEGDIIVPDIKPDMALILKTDADVFFDKTEVSANRINYGGKLNIRALYMSKAAEKSIHSVTATTAIDDFINMEGVTKDMWVHISGSIANIEYRMINDRKIGYKAIVDMSVTADTKVEYDVVTGLDGLSDAQVRKSKLNVNKTVEMRDDKITVKDDLPVPTGKPNIREILQTGVTVSNKEVKVLNSRVNVTGELIISTLYKGDDEENLVEFMEHELPFNGSIEIPGAKEGMIGDVALKVADRYNTVRPDEDGEDRVLELEVSMNAAVKVTNQTEIEILDDAYCINKNLNIKKEPVTYPRLICRNKNQCPVKEIVQLDENCPGIMQIFRVWGDARLDDVKVMEDKVVVEGVINTDILYIANDDNSPLYNYRALLPYKQVIETKGCLPDMDVDIELCIDHAGFNMLSENEVELRFLISFNTKVIDNVEAGIVTDIDVSDIEKEELDKIASMVIYVVQKGDSLWSIAKRYNASLEDLISINDIENPDLIYPGQKLLIIKKAAE